MAIYYVWLKLPEGVCCGLDEFKTFIDKYVQADFPVDVESICEAWLATKGVRMEKVSSVQLAHQQDRSWARLPVPSLELKSRLFAPGGWRRSPRRRRGRGREVRRAGRQTAPSSRSSARLAAGRPASPRVQVDH
jgi:hypothetical protein